MQKRFSQLRFSGHKSNAGFTLIELLIVIGIVAILGTVVTLTLSPVEHLKRARDSNRLTDLAILHKTLSLYKLDNPDLYFGASNIVYVSLPDTDSACAGWGLPPLAGGWTYSCKTEADYKKVDGTGWIPVNLKFSIYGQVLSLLPIDPKNNADNYFYYVYDPVSKTYELGTPLEAERNQYLATRDGGDNPNFYEIGTGLSLYSMGSNYLVVRNESDNLVYNENNFLMYALAASAGQTAFFIDTDKITGSNEFFWNNSTKRLGIGTAGPDYKLDVQGGQINSSGGLCIAGDCKTAWSQVGGSGDMQYSDSRFKVGSFTREVTAASGNVAYTGVGFQPKAIIILGGKGPDDYSTGGINSIGLSDAISNASMSLFDISSKVGNSAHPTVINWTKDGSTGQKAVVASFNSDGFTLTWTKLGSPSAETIIFYYLALR